MVDSKSDWIDLCFAELMSSGRPDADSTKAGVKKKQRTT